MPERRITFIHGIWLPGSSMRFLARKLKADHGCESHLFSYASVRGSVDENAALLADFIIAEDLAGTHVVGHSLGGVVALRMLRNHDDVDVGRVVCLGSPLAGSRAATGLAAYGWGRAIAGHTLSAGVLDEPASVWAGDVTARFDVGCIAGTMSMGAGRLMTRFDEQNDGTVAVSETRLPGLRDHLCLPVNHTGLVLSTAVAEQVAAFLRSGRFNHRSD